MKVCRVPPPGLQEWVPCRRLSAPPLASSCSSCVSLCSSQTQSSRHPTYHAWTACQAPPAGSQVESPCYGAQLCQICNSLLGSDSAQQAPASPCRESAGPARVPHPARADADPSLKEKPAGSDQCGRDKQDRQFSPAEQGWCKLMYIPSMLDDDSAHAGSNLFCVASCSLAAPVLQRSLRPGEKMWLLPPSSTWDTSCGSLCRRSNGPHHQCRARDTGLEPVRLVACGCAPSAGMTDTLNCSQHLACQDAQAATWAYQAGHASLL